MENQSRKKRNLLSFIRTTIGKILILAICVVVAFAVGRLTDKKDSSSKSTPLVTKESSLSAKYLSDVLQAKSELTTYQMDIRGLSDFTDTGVKFLNRSDFKMLYKAEMQAGFDLDDVKISVDEQEKLVKVELPKSRVLHAAIPHPSEIKIFDERFSLFNWNEKEDFAEAQELAIKEAYVEAQEMKLLELADEHAELVIRSLLGEIVAQSGYTLLINDKLGEGVTTTAKPTATATAATPTTTKKAA